MDRYTNDSSLKTNTSLTKSDGMKQEIFLNFIRKVHKIYILVCFMWQNDFITMLGLTGCTYSVKLERIKYSEGQLRILDLKHIFDLVNHAQQVIKNKDIPFVLLIDSVDSGLSPDFAIKIQQMIRQFINHNTSSNLRVLLVSNTYELFQNWDEDKTDIIDARTFEKVHFSSYEDYVTYCQKRTSYKRIVVGTNIYRD